MDLNLKTEQVITKSAIGIVRLWFNRFILWFYTKAFTILLTIFGSLIGRKRMSHNNGIGARGKVTIVDNPELIAHPFFEPNKTYPCRIRHAGASFNDDAMRVVRSMSLKFADDQFKSPFDLELNTGKVALFWSVASFMRFAKYKKTKYGIQYHKYYKNYPAGVKGAQSGMRRNPDSFSNLNFYSQTPLFYIGSDDVNRYAKYRVVPFEDVQETGLLNAYDMSNLSENQRILPGEKRTRNYLKEEYKKRIASGIIKYKLQIQLHTAADDDDDELFNCCREWEEDSHPWLELAVIEIEKILTWEESCILAFSLGNLPESLGVIPAKSIYDYNSLNYMRKNSELARKSRVWSFNLFGVPSELPDNDDRNQ